MRGCPVIVVPGFARPVVTVADYRAFLSSTPTATIVSGLSAEKGGRGGRACQGHPLHTARPSAHNRGVKGIQLQEVERWPLSGSSAAARATAAPDTASATGSAAPRASRSTAARSRRSATPTAARLGHGRAWRRCASPTGRSRARAVSGVRDRGAFEPTLQAKLPGCSATARSRSTCARRRRSRRRAAAIRARTALAVLDYAGVSPNPARDRAAETAARRARRGRASARRPRRGGGVAAHTRLPDRTARARRDRCPRRRGRGGDDRRPGREPRSMARAGEGCRRRGVHGGSSCPTICSASSSIAFRRVRIATRRLRCSRSSRPTGCAWRSAAPAETRPCRCSAARPPPPPDQPAPSPGRESGPEIGARVGQRNISDDRRHYTHVLMDYREIDRPKLLDRVRTTHPPMHTPEARNASFAATF